LGRSTGRREGIRAEIGKNGITETKDRIRMGKKKKPLLRKDVTQNFEDEAKKKRNWDLGIRNGKGIFGNRFTHWERSKKSAHGWTREGVGSARSHLSKDLR